MAENLYKIGITAAVNGVDEESVKKSADVIVGLLEKTITSKKGNKLQDIFGLPKPNKANIKEWEDTLNGLNLQVIKIKDNIATIRFNSGGMDKFVDVAIRGKDALTQTLRVIGDMEYEVDRVGGKYKELTKEIETLTDKVREGLDKKQPVGPDLEQLQKMVDEYKEIRDRILEIQNADVKVGLGGNETLSKITNIYDQYGAISGRILTIKTNTGEVRQEFQKWDNELLKFEVTQTRVTDNFEANEKAAEKLQKKIRSILDRETDSALKRELTEIQQKLAGVDNYSGEAAGQIKQYTNEVSKAVGMSKQREQVTRQYTAAARELAQAEAALQIAQIEESGSIGSANERAKESVKLYKNQKTAIEAKKNILQQSMKVFGAETEATRIDSEEKAKAIKKVYEFSQMHEKSASILERFGNSLADAADRVVNYTLVYRAMDTVVRVFKNSIQTTKELDAAFTDIEMVMLKSGSSIHELKLQYAELAQEMSASIVEVAKGKFLLL